MKTLKRTATFLCLTAILFLVPAACEKNSDDDKEQTKTELLCREWKVVSIGGLSANYECECDETLMSFKSDGKFSMIFKLDGAVIEDESFDGQWEWQVQDESVTLEFQYFSEEEGWVTGFTILDIQQLTKDYLWFIFADDDEVYKCVPK
ncbi:MAG TPA: hypothetical protein PLJ84_11405 [Bacteroidales bacterium]|nr:hypothetical protein [Bacteroidales bacterium]HPT03195.1 hypothetical protein [Bacteroidales bacterium]